MVHVTARLQLAHLLAPIEADTCRALPSAYNFEGLMILGVGAALSNDLDGFFVSAAQAPSVPPISIPLFHRPKLERSTLQTAMLQHLDSQLD